MGLIIDAITSSLSQGFVETGNQGAAVLAELIHHLGEARQIVAAG